MIRVAVFQTPEKEYRGFRMEGHAGAGDYGTDIVCSAVSMLVLNTVNSIEAFTDAGFTCEAAEDGGYLQFTFTEEPDDDAVLLVRAMMLGLEETVKQYGKKYIKIRYEEV